MNVYAGAGAGDLSATARRAKSLVYVPNNATDTVQVIDPRTFKVAVLSAMSPSSVAVPCALM